MEWLLLCITTLLAVEVFLRTSFKRNIKIVLDFTQRSRATISSGRISDHWKEKVLLHYASKIFVNSMQLLLCILLTAVAIFGGHVLGSFFAIDLLSLFAAPFGLVTSILFALIYVYFRGKILNV